jgi:tyrosine-protein kinase Etk/Wzc
MSDIQTLGSNRIILSPMQRLFGESFNPALLLIILRKSLLWCILILLFTTGAAFLYLRYTHPLYEASAILIYRPQNTAQDLQLSSNTSNPYTSKNATDVISNDIQVVESPIVLRQAIAKLPLRIAYYHIGSILIDEMYNSSFFSIESHLRDSSILNVPVYITFTSATAASLTYKQNGIAISRQSVINQPINFPWGTLIVRTINPVPNAFQEGKYYFVINSTDNVISQIRGGLQVLPSNSMILEQMDDQKATKAADILNSINASFIDYDRISKTQSAQLTLDFIRSQLDSANRGLDTYEGELRDFRVSNNFISPESKESEIVGNIIKWEDAHDQAVKMQKEMGIYMQYLLLNIDSPALLMPPVYTDLESISSFVTDFNALKTRYNDMRLSYGNDNLKLQIAGKQIEDSKKEVVKNLTAQQNLQNTYAADDQQKLTAAKAALNDLPLTEAEYNKLSRLSDLKEKYYMILLDKQSEFDVLKAGFISNYMILHPADVPGSSIYPNYSLIKFIGFISGLIICFLLVIIRYLMNHNILSPAELAADCKAGILGVIPKFDSQMDISEMVVMKKPKAILSESFRAIRANIDFIGEGYPKVICVTSTVAGEGKTFVSLNLAGIMAMSGKKTILLDYDLRKPKLHISYKTPNEKGLSTVYIGKYDIEECIQHSEWENLDFITSGPIPPNPAEFIASPQTLEILDRLKQKYDVIVCDTAPIGIVTDAHSLLQNCTAPVYIVRADYSSRNYINNINRLYLDNKLTRLTVILNDMGEGASKYGYSYGYNYGYGYGYGYGYAYGRSNRHGQGYSSYYDEGEKQNFWQRLRKAIAGK